MDDANGVPHDETGPAESAGRRRNSRTDAQSDLRAAPRTPEPRTIGEALRQAREAAGLTLAQIAERTKVRPGILADIEADAHDRLPALTYSLGFVKAYARTVGLDPLASAERYRLESQKGDPVPSMIDLQPLEQKRLPSRGLVLGTVAALLVLLAGFWAWGAGWLTQPLPSPPETSVDVAAAEPDEAGAATATPTLPAPDAPVTLTATEEVWLRIADGQETFFMGTMVKGQTMTLPPGRAWTLRTGRAGALAVKVGGTDVAPLGGPAEQVRDVSLKPADLVGRPGVAASGLAPTRALDGPVQPPASSLDTPAAPAAPAG